MTLTVSRDSAPDTVIPAQAGIHSHLRMNRSLCVYILMSRKHLTLFLSPRAWPLDARVKPGDDVEGGRPVMTERGGKTVPPYSSCPDEDPGIQ